MTLARTKMRRRDVIAFLCGAAAYPLLGSAPAPAQQAMPVIGFLRSSRFSNAMHLVAAFRQGLNETGFVEGQNVAIEFRAAEDREDRLPSLAAELVRRPVAVIVGNTPAARAAKAATTTIPIVFTTGNDPVGDGLVASLNRPGGNVTGAAFFAAELGAKRLELLRQLVPQARIIAMLVNPYAPGAEAERRDVQAAAAATGQQLHILNVDSERDLEPAFAAFMQGGAGALLVGSAPFLTSQRERLVALAARHRLPAMHVLRDAAMAGGLMSYGSSNTDVYRQAGVYAGRILKGEKPSDLPVVRSAKFELVLNLRTARTLGLEIPNTLLALADGVIE